MSDKLASQVAAGEVVERPESVKRDNHPPDPSSKFSHNDGCLVAVCFHRTIRWKSVGPLDTPQSSGQLAPIVIHTMKTGMIFALLAAFWLPGTLWALEVNVDAELEKLASSRQAGIVIADKPLTDLDARYRDALEQRKKECQNKGDLDGVLAVDKALALEGDAAFSGSFATDPKIVSIQQTYRNTREGTVKRVNQARLEVDRQYAVELEKLVKELTQLGETEKALEVRKVKEDFVAGVRERAAMGKLQEMGTANGKAFVRFSRIPAGKFTMGDGLDNDKDAPEHEVTLGAYFIAQKETTKAEWDTVRAWGMEHGYTDLAAGAGKAADHPVQFVSWFDVVKWCNARSEKDGLKPCYTTGGQIYKTGQVAPECEWNASGYRLPTEAEWEKAARGGVPGRRFPWGNVISHAQANFRNVGGEKYQSGTGGHNPKYAVGGEPFTAPVGSFAPNGYGLYDMTGNLWEWCWDWADDYKFSPEVNPRGPGSGSHRVLRGGSWYGDANDCRVAIRINYTPTSSYVSFGFRVARDSAP